MESDPDLDGETLVFDPDEAAVLADTDDFVEAFELWDDPDSLCDADTPIMISDGGLDPTGVVDLVVTFEVTLGLAGLLLAVLLAEGEEDLDDFEGTDDFAACLADLLS